MPEQKTRVHFCDMSELHIAEMEEENVSIKEERDEALEAFNRAIEQRDKALMIAEQAIADRDTTLARVKELEGEQTKVDEEMFKLADVYIDESLKCRALQEQNAVLRQLVSDYRDETGRTLLSYNPSAEELAAEEKRLCSLQQRATLLLEGREDPRT